MAKKNMSVAAKFAEVAEAEEKRNDEKTTAPKKPNKPGKVKPKANKEDKKTILTAEDRRKMKTDFDPPSVDQEEYKQEAKRGNVVIMEDEKPQEKKMGQPRKYNEAVKHVSFSLPLSIIEDLKILSAIRKTNQTQIILEMIKEATQKDGEKIEAYKKLVNN